MQRIIRSSVEIETNRRIKLSMWAYTYEFENRSIVSDAVFDVECMMVDLSINTNRPDLDVWFRENFNPSTGMWIHKHPELEKIAKLVAKHVAKS